MRGLTLGIAWALLWAPAYAESPPEDAKRMIEQKLSVFAPGMSVDDIEYAPVENFYEVTIGTQVVYISRDGKHIMLGELLEIDSRRNLTEQRRATLTAKKLDGYGPENMIVIGPNDSGRHVTVFTDVDCPYCAKFHRDVPTLNAAGVQVRYLLFPRTGIGGRSYQRSVGVWCSDDPVESVGIAKAGGEVEYRECDNPVKAHYELGQEIGITGTPAIILDDGRMIAGYVPPRRLIEQLGMSPPAQ